MVSAVSPFDPRRRAELLAVARDVFAELGFEAATLREIADRMGLTAGSLYHYIDSKQSLLAAVMQSFQEPPIALARPVPGDGTPVAERLTALMREHVEIITADRPGMALAMTELDSMPQPARSMLRDRMREYRRAIEDLLRVGQASGQLRAGFDPALATMAVLGALNWTSRWLQPDGRLSPGEVGEQLADLLLYGLASPDATLGPELVVEPPASGSIPQGRGRQVWEAAAHLFRTQGVANSSIQDLADAVGLGKSSLYHYITTKEQLLFDVIREAEEGAVDALEAVVARPEPAIDRLYAAIRYDVRYLIEHLDSTSLALHAVRELEPGHREIVVALVRRYAAAFEALIGAGRAEGSLRDQPEAVVALRGSIGVMSWTYRWYRPRGAGDAARVADGLADVLMHGLAER